MTAVSVLDDQTTAAIREAMTAVRSGRIPEAVAIGERALANGGDGAVYFSAIESRVVSSTGTYEAEWSGTLSVFSWAAFALAGVITFLAAVFWGFVLPEIQPVQWRTAAEPTTK